jgi:hypothetical protein
MATGTGSATITFPVSAQAAQYVSEVVTTDTPPSPHNSGTFSASLTEWADVCSYTFTTYVKSKPSIAYNGSIYVSITTSGKFAYSYNGITWVETATTVEVTVGVWWAGTNFCAIRGGGTTTCFISSDGINWSAMAARPTESGDCLAYSPGGVIIFPDGGGNGIGHYSVNGGNNWTALSYPWTNTAFAAYGNGVFVIGRKLANGLAYGPGNSAFTVSSTTGNSPIFAATKFFATDSVSGWVTSTNGITWTAHPTMPPSYPGITPYPVYLGGKLYAFDANTGTLTYHVSSDEGVTWVEGNTGGKIGAVLDILINGKPAKSTLYYDGYGSACTLSSPIDEYSGNVEVAVTRSVTTVNTEVVPAKPVVGTNQASIALSATSRTTPSIIRGTAIYGNGKFLLWSADLYGYSMTSVDGFNWVQTARTSESYSARLAVGNGKFLAIPSSPVQTTSLVSTDGDTWDSYALPLTGSWIIGFGKDKFVATLATTNTGYVSTDAINWSEITLPSSSSWRTIDYMYGKFIVTITSSATFIYSSDGISWEQGTFPTTAQWRSWIATNGVLSILIAASSTNAYMTTTDGVNWVARTLPETAVFTDVVYINGKFMVGVINTTTVYTSIDGISWTLNNRSSVLGGGARVITDGNVALQCSAASSTLEVLNALGSDTQLTSPHASAITSTSQIEAWIQGTDSTADHNALEHELAGIQLSVGDIVAGSGFTITATSDERLTGDFKVRYVWKS